MSDLRALIRELLSEEIAALRAEILGGVPAERISVASEADLTAFALSVARRAQEPGFLAGLEAGRIRFAPLGGPVPANPAPANHAFPAGAGTVAGGAFAPPAPPTVTQPVRLVTTTPAPVPELRKGLVTERDIAGIGEGESRLRLMKNARLTPLAADEARRRGIRIERTLA